jgi:hypothetical protein
MDVTRITGLTLPLLIALVGCDFVGMDSATRETTAVSASKFVAPTRAPKTNALARKAATRLPGPIAEGNRRALASVAILGLGFSSLSTSTR